jgi:solute carrier family 13 (sodium-dependent dicarboxylate transporter), member 2/3/5
LSDTSGLLRRRIGLIAGLAVSGTILLLPRPEGMTAAAQSMAAVALLMAIWWITEATHIAITALLPIPLFPLLGIMPSAAVAPHYTNHIVFLYIGGFIIALAMEKWDLHRRVALGTIARFGTRPERLVLGFMVATAFLSMWISNTATTMMMLPIATAVVRQLAELASSAGKPGDSHQIESSFGLVLLLGIAYSASIGGIGTIIGSPTNIAFVGFAQREFPNEQPITFLDWSLMCVPIVVVFLPLAWAYLCRFGAEVPLKSIRFSGGQEVIDAERRRLGPLAGPERTVLLTACATSLLWIFREPLELGGFRLPGWSGLFASPEMLHDSTVAVAMGVLLCLLPVNLRGGMQWKGRHERFIMDWETIQKGIPWGIVLLFGGGFALAAGIDQTGLDDWIGGQLGVLKGTPVWVLVPASCLMAALFTETTSNIATVLMISPVIAATAVEIGVHPYLLLIPAAVMASFAFMLPVATPPNAIVFSSGWITIPQMFRAGFALDLLALVVVPTMVYFLGSAVIGLGG